MRYSGQYPEMGFADSRAPAAREKFETFASRGDQMKDATEAALHAVIDRDAAAYRASLESLQPGAGPHGRDGADHLPVEVRAPHPRAEGPEIRRDGGDAAQGVVVPPDHPEVGPEFADRFTFEESKALWARFEPLDAMLQGDEEMFEPSFQSGPMRYYFSDLPDGVDTESFIAGWERSA